MRRVGLTPDLRMHTWLGAVEGVTLLVEMTQRRVFVLLAILGVTACETIHGAGQDIENAGEAISEEANEAQAGM